MGAYTNVRVKQLKLGLQFLLDILDMVELGLG